MSKQTYICHVFTVDPGRTPEQAWKANTSYHHEGEDLVDANLPLAYCFAIIATAIPIGINGTLLRFHKGHSTHAQRV